MDKSNKKLKTYWFSLSLLLIVTFLLSACQSSECLRTKNRITQLKSKVKSKEISDFERTLDRKELARLRLYLRNRC